MANWNNSYNNPNYYNGQTGVPWMYYNPNMQTSGQVPQLYMNSMPYNATATSAVPTPSYPNYQQQLPSQMYYPPNPNVGMMSSYNGTSVPVQYTVPPPNYQVPSQSLEELSKHVPSAQQWATESTSKSVPHVSYREDNTDKQHTKHRGPRQQQQHHQQHLQQQQQQHLQQQQQQHLQQQQQQQTVNQQQQTLNQQQQALHHIQQRRGNWQQKQGHADSSASRPHLSQKKGNMQNTSSNYNSQKTEVKNVPGRNEAWKKVLADTAAFMKQSAEPPKTSNPPAQLSCEQPQFRGPDSEITNYYKSCNLPAVQQQTHVQQHRGNRTFMNSKYYKNGGGANIRPEEHGRRNYKKDVAPKAQNVDSIPKKMILEDKVQEDYASQMERLIEQLSRGTYECMVCCERIRQQDNVWGCSNCYHVFHLWCIKKWAKSSKGERGWRCPACQNETDRIPLNYYCCCGKVQNPPWNRRDTPHTCGEMCGRERKEKDCVHKCVVLCHPGPCPPCCAQVNRTCGCGKTTQSVLCGQRIPLLCGQECQKTLDCTVHKCQKKCHENECDTCMEKIKQECYCGANMRELVCCKEIAGIEKYSCENICNKELQCGQHSCQQICHAGPCGDCHLLPEHVTHCPCGKMTMEEMIQKNISVPRVSCTDSIATCGSVCEMSLSCGHPSDLHKCENECHVGSCPPCPKTTRVKCRCGNMDMDILCVDLKSKADDARCERKCTKKRSCGRHKCGQICCIDLDHICPLICGRALSCGLHKCEELCHLGNCPTCYRTSFEELACYCGETVLYPPVPCGTKPPECDRPCTRQHECDHPVLHSCHSDDQCPPCTILTEKWCHGKHEIRKNVLCFLTAISCGKPCNFPLPCGNHKCLRTCHEGDCIHPNEKCQQPCGVIRTDCGHPCGITCHDGECPESPCKELVKISCQCGHRSASMTCNEKESEYRRVVTSVLALRMADVQLGQSVEMGDLLSCPADRKDKTKILECNEECALIERNRRIALALQIENPDLSNKLGPPKYSQLMKDWAKKDGPFAQMVHDKLAELVQLAKESKQKSRSYSFECMNREKRQFIHEYCTHFGCESHAYDQEPKRNVVATAVKDKSWLPSQSLMQVYQREIGQRKPPAPVINMKAKNSNVSSTVVNLTDLAQPAVQNAATNGGAVSKSSENAKESEVIDYFEYQE